MVEVKIAVGVRVNYFNLFILTNGPDCNVLYVSVC